MKKFIYSFNGLKDCFKDKAILTQFILALMAIIGGFIIKLNFNEWLAFVICIGLVISMEVVNSIAEQLCDLYSTNKDERIRKIKDMASAGVLISAICALCVCVMCVLRRF